MRDQLDHLPLHSVNSRTGRDMVSIVDIVLLKRVRDTSRDRGPPPENLLDNGSQHGQFLTVLPLRAPPLTSLINLLLKLRLHLGEVAHGQQVALDGTADGQGTSDGHKTDGVHRFVLVRVGPFEERLLVDKTRSASIILSVLVLDECSQETGSRVAAGVHFLNPTQVHLEQALLELVAPTLSLLPGANARRDMCKPVDDIRKRTRGGDSLEQAKCGLAQNFSRVRAAPRKARDDPRSELLDPLNVLATVL